MAGVEQRVTDLELAVAEIEGGLGVAEARLDDARNLIRTLINFGKEAGIRIAAVEERAKALEKRHTIQALEEGGHSRREDA